jgi:hypothetical protein
MRLDGRRKPERRSDAAFGTWGIVLSNGKYLTAAQYKKTGTIFAIQIPEDFEVETLEGVMRGKAGSWLAVGADGEMWPIDNAIFSKTYERMK